MTTFDSTGNLHGDDGKFAPQHKAEVGDAGLDAYQPLAPSEDVYAQMQAVKSGVDEWHSLLETAEVVDAYISEGDFSDADRNRIRYIALEVKPSGDDGYNVYQATAYDEGGNRIDGNGPFEASPYGPEIPPEAFSADASALLNTSDVIDVRSIRSYDWVHGQQTFRDTVSGALA